MLVSCSFSFLDCSPAKDAGVPGKFWENGGFCQTADLAACPLFLLLHLAAMEEEDEGEGKQAKDKSVFFRFGDDLAVDDNPHRATAACRKIAIQKAISVVIEGSRKEIADGFVDDAGAHPSRGIPCGIGKTATSGNTNPYIIRVSAIFIHI